jgi:hypothetical protein
VASYSGTTSVHNKTLTAATADTVTLSGDFQYVRIVKLSTLSSGITGGSIYYKVHTSADDAADSPAVAEADGTRVIPDVVAVRNVPTPSTVTILTLISAAGGVRYSVEGAD